MPKLNKITLLGVKTEASHNAGAALAATDYIWAQDVTIDPKVEKLPRDYSRGYLEPIPELVGKRSYEIKFKKELKGSGLSTTLVDAPTRALLEACGLSAITTEASASSFKTSSTATSGFYGPGKSAYFEIYFNGSKHSVSGAMGSAKVTLPVSNIPMLEFTFQGHYSDPSEISLPTATVNSTNAPVVQSAGLGIIGYTPVAANIEIDLSAKVVERPDVTAAAGLAGFMVTGFEPKGSFDPEVVSISTKSFINELVSGTTGTLSAQIGSTAGNRVTISGACVQYSSASYANRNDILVHNIPFGLYSYQGGDALVIKFT